MRKLIIVRGLPGSGKSTLARSFKEESGYEWFEADMYFIERGEYKFDPAQLYNAHKWCYENTYRYLLSYFDVIVSNTFTTNSEMKQYFELREFFPDLEIDVIEVHSQFGSIHGVPEETLEKMKNRWEEVDPKYGITSITKVGI